MLRIPFPLVLAEIFIFWSFVNRIGFINTMLIYFVPCLLGFLIINSWGRVTMVSLQASLARGEVPGPKVLHAGAIFLSGLCFALPTFSSRVFGLILLLPGLRHLFLWKFKAGLLKKMTSGGGAFNFSGFQFGSTGAGPFGRHTSYTDVSSERPREREVFDANVLDVKPLEIVHETQKSDEDR